MSRKISKGLSITEKQFTAAMNRAKAEGRSFSFIVCRALERDLVSRTVKADPALPAPGPDDTVYTKDVAARLDISPRTVIRRATTPGDPLHSARSKLGKQKPFAFSASKIVALQRGLVAACVTVASLGRELLTAA